jgi:DnaJ like chaperone protein
MFWLGKILGFMFGYLIAGPLGAILGLFLGHYFDISRRKHWYNTSTTQPTHRTTQEVFFKATFSVMGHIAKADGRVSEDEIRAAETIMHRMLLTLPLRHQAIQIFTAGKQHDFNLDDTLSELSRACFAQRDLLRMFLEIQLQAASADGMLNATKRRIFEHICYRLGFVPEEFLFRGWQDGQNYRKAETKPTDKLGEAYRTLGVSTSVNNVELKKTYRKLMSQHHPDKLISKGLPDEMLKLATQKTQEIKSAYELICKARGV